MFHGTGFRTSSAYQVFVISLKSILHGKESSQSSISDKFRVVLKSAEKDGDFAVGGHGAARLTRGRGRDLYEGVDGRLADAAGRVREDIDEGGEELRTGQVLRVQEVGTANILKQRS